MKKIFGVSVETNIGIAALFLSSLFYVIVTNNIYFIIWTSLIAVTYLGMVIYFKYIFPYRPFYITLNYAGYKKDEIILTGNGMKVKILKKIITNRFGTTTYKVKPVKPKQTK